MAVKIRLKRMGAKKKPFYRLVAADSRSPRDGKFIENLGTHNPLNGENTGFSIYVMTDNKNIKIKSIKLKYNDYYISEEEKNFILNIDSNFLTEKTQISLRKNRFIRRKLCR